MPRGLFFHNMKRADIERANDKLRSGMRIVIDHANGLYMPEAPPGYEWRRENGNDILWNIAEGMAP